MNIKWIIFFKQKPKISLFYLYIIKKIKNFNFKTDHVH